MKTTTNEIPPVENSEDTAGPKENSPPELGIKISKNLRDRKIKIDEKELEVPKAKKNPIFYGEDTEKLKTVRRKGGKQAP